MFIMLPLLPLFSIYIVAAVLPAVILLRYVYRHDTVEKEPAGLLLFLLLLGVLSALCAGMVERLTQRILNWFVEPESLIHTILFAFLVVAVAEEAAKFFFLKRWTWNHPAFNYRFDGIVYAVFVSLGFAAYENIQYVLHYGLSVALPRALLAVPGHMSFAVFMGLFYGRAKLCAGYGDVQGEKLNLTLGYVIAVFFHGFYDACAMRGTVMATIIFIAFVVLMYLLVYRTLKRESVSDMPL